MADNILDTIPDKFPNNFVSGGRNPLKVRCCDMPRCIFLSPNPGGDGGWCIHGANNDGVMSGTPSVSSTGGCDLHEPVMRAEVVYVEETD